MSRNGSGTYSLASGNPVTTGATISSTTHNNTLSDIATALTDSLAKDGQTTPTADLPMGTYKHTGVGDATARTQYAKVSQVQDGGYVTLSSVSGADTITATCAPAITAYAAGQFFTFVAAGANTGAVTLNINSLGAKAVTKEGTTALAAGEIASGAVVCVEYDGTRFQVVGGRSVQPLDADLTAIAALANTDSNFIVGNGSTWVVESGATARTSLGVVAASTTTAGLVELTTDAEGLGGSDTTRAVTSAALASSKSLAANGYMKLPGGLLLQWGTVAVSAGAWSTVTYPVAFTAVARPVGWAEPFRKSTFYRNSGLTSFETRAFDDGAGVDAAATIIWIAIGY